MKRQCTIEEYSLKTYLFVNNNILLYKLSYLLSTDITSDVLRKDLSTSIKKKLLKQIQILRAHVHLYIFFISSPNMFSYIHSSNTI